MKARTALLSLLTIGGVAAVGALWPSRPTEAPPMVATGIDAGIDGGSDAGNDVVALAEPRIEATETAIEATTAIEGPPGSSIALAIEPDAPERVAVLAERRDYGSVFALVTVDRSQTAAEDEADDPEMDEEEGLGGPCASEEDSDDAFCECVVAHGATIDAGWAEALERSVVRLLLVHLAREGELFRVQAQVELTEPVLVEDIEGVELRGSDLDGDGRTEITAIFGFTVPDCDTFQEDAGTLGAIFDAGDLHLQAAFVRASASTGGDSDVNSDSIETVWRAADEDGDGHADLRVRATTRSASSDPPDDETYEHETRASTVCPYDLTTDRWQCPDGALPIPTWFSSVAPFLSRSPSIP